MNTPTPPQPVAESGLSASRRVYLALRQRIVGMDMLPGVRIVERDIAEEFGTSRTPVHEARRVARTSEPSSIPRFFGAVALCVVAGIAVWYATRRGYDVVVAPEGVPTVSVSYLALAGPVLDDELRDGVATGERAVTLAWAEPSSADVASLRISRSGRFSTARAIAARWRCASESRDPPAPT